MDKLPGFLVALLMAIAGPLVLAYGGYWWALDRPAWHVGWCPFCVGWSAGANVQLAQSRADFATERQTVQVLRKAFDVENGSILTLQTASDRWQEASRQALIKAAAANAWRLSTAARIMALPEPADSSELGQCRAAYGVLKDTGQ